MKSDDITKLGLLVAKMKGDITEYRTVLLSARRGEIVFFYNNPRNKGFEASKQDLEYLAEQNEEAKHLIVKLILNGDLP